MNKKLLALAIGAAVAMPVAALADGPTLYGKLNLSLENQTNNAGTANSVDASTWVVRNNSSRIGVKGTADTSVEGVSGVYLAEFGVGADGDGAVLTARNIYAGVKGDFGSVLVGNIDTPLKSAQGSVDQFNDSSMDMAFTVVGETRASDVVAYVSPKLGDAVTITVASWQGEEYNDPAGAAGTLPYDSVFESVSASVVYANEGLTVGLGYDNEVPTQNGVGLLSAGDVLNTARLVATYATDSFSVGGLYQTAELANAPTGFDPSNTSLLVSGAVKAGDWTFKAQYATTDSEITGGTATIDGYAVGADYALGKSTTVGVLVGGQSTDTPGADPEFTTYGVNLVQSF